MSGETWKQRAEHSSFWWSKMPFGIITYAATACPEGRSSLRREVPHWAFFPAPRKFPGI